MNVNDWLFIIENQPALSQVPKSLWCNALTPFVRKTSFEMRKRHIQTGSLYDLFKKDLINTFLPVYHERIVRSQLLNLSIIFGLSNAPAYFTQIFRNR